MGKRCGGTIGQMAAVALTLAAGPAFAHHSFGIFDMGKPITLVGTVSTFDFVNPHGYVTLAVPVAGAAPQSWRIEVANPNQLLRFGWKKDTLKPGDRVTVAGFPARDGSNFVIGREFTLADGRKVFGAPRQATP